MPDSTITLRTRADLAALIETGKSFNVLSKEEQQAEKDALRLAQSMARVDASLKDPATGAARLRAALAGATYIDPTQGVSALNQLVSLEQKAEAEAARLTKANAGLGTAGGLPILPRTVESFGTQALDQVKSGLLGIVGPAALVTGGMTLATRAVESFTDAFKFKAQLDQNTASISAQLIGVRDSKQAFQEAAVFADKYKLTQEETTTAIQASVPLLRQSKSSLTDVLTVLSQLQVLKPEQGIQGAAFALAELQGGQSRSLATRFNIPIAKATEMKNEIQKGADAVQVLGKYLDNAGIGAAALEVRTKGAAGAMNTLAVQQERLKLAQADLASGPGIAALDLQTRVTTGLTRVLGGGGGLVEAIKNANAEWVGSIARQHAFNDALDAGATRADAAAAGDAAYANALKRVADVSTNVSDGIQQVTDASDRHKAATLADIDIEDLRARALSAASSARNKEITDLQTSVEEKFAATQQSQKLNEAETTLANIGSAVKAGLITSAEGANTLASQFGYAFSEALKLVNISAQVANTGRKGIDASGSVGIISGFQQAAKAADDLKAAQDRGIIQNGSYSQKLALLRSQLKGLVPDTAAYVDKQNEITALQQSQAKGYNSELGKQLTTQESIYDALNKQRDAQISIQKLTAENTIKTLDEDKKLRSARAVLAKPEASAEQKARAQASIDIISADRAQREQELRKQSATAGGTITDKGKLLQSVPGGGQPSQFAGGPIAPQAPGTQQPAASGGQGTPLILTMDGREVGKIVLPFLVDELLTGVRQVRASKGA